MEIRRENAMAEELELDVEQSAMAEEAALDLKEHAR
jgi:hypothetical protein